MVQEGAALQGQAKFSWLSEKSGAGRDLLLLSSPSDVEDAMAVCRVYGPPNVFVAFTCNNRGRELADALHFELGQHPCDHSDLSSRVFKVKVSEFITDIREGRTFGPVLKVLHTAEFQKQGFPHIHCLVWLAASSSECSAPHDSRDTIILKDATRGVLGSFIDKTSKCVTKKRMEKRPFAYEGAGKKDDGGYADDTAKHNA